MLNIVPATAMNFSANKPVDLQKSATPWWGRTSTMLTFMLMSTMPLWFASTPPLIDYVGHLARYHVALDIAQNPDLARNWSYHWALIANLGVDLLIMPLARLIGLERAGWTIAALLPPLMIWGIFRAARAVHGEIPPSAIAAIPLALAYPYQYGFVNFWLASGLALHAFASWISLERRVRLRSLLFVPISLLIWVCHAYGWAVLGVLVGGYELGRSWQAGNRKPLRTGLKSVARTWPLLITLVAMIIWRTNAPGAETFGWFRMQWKSIAVVTTLRDRYALLDYFSLVAITFLIYFGIRDARAKMDPRFGIAALIFGAALILLPLQLFGSAFADGRVCAFLFMTALLSIRLRDGGNSKRTAAIIAAGFAALFAVRVGASAIGYAEYDAAYKRHLTALRHIERGSSVAVLFAMPCSPPWRMSRLDHLGSMALLRRDAFVNTQWDVPGAELLRPKHVLGNEFNADPSQFVWDKTCPDDLRPLLAARIAKIPAGYFDYVWILNFGRQALPIPKTLKRLYADENSSLYRVTDIDRSTTAAKSSAFR